MAYSADVRLHLVANGHVVPLSHVSQDFLILDAAADMPPCDAEVVVTVDGREHRRRVHLEDGLSKASQRVRIVPCTDDCHGRIS